MAKFIDRGVKKADDPIYTEGISITSISKQPKPPTPLLIENLIATIKETRSTILIILQNKTQRCKTLYAINTPSL